MQLQESPNTAAANKIKTRIWISIDILGNAEMAPATKSKESPGRKGGEYKPGFAKYNNEQDSVCPSMVILHYTNHVLINVENKV